MHIPPSRPDEDAAIEELRDDPEYAVEYLNAVLEDGNQVELRRALRRLDRAFGGVSTLAEQTELDADFLYNPLSPQANPELKHLTSLLKVMGLRLAVQPIAHVQPNAVDESGEKMIHA